MFFIGFLPDKHNGTKKKKKGFHFSPKNNCIRYRYSVEFSQIEFNEN